MKLPDKNGLTLQEVTQKKESGQVNVNPDDKGKKTIGGIILSNLLTFFNILNIAYFVLIIAVGSYKNGLFLWIIVVNTVIGIIQEIRTKKALDQLSLLTESKVTVIRGGEESVIPVNEIVMDDVLLLKSGNQIPTDSIVMEGELEVNESLVTGESDDISKRPGNQLLSGSFVTGGTAYVKVIHVGKDNYIETISGEAKKFKRVKSELRDSINKILKIIAFAIIPLSVGLFAKLYFLQHESFKTAIEQVVSSGIGMIPEGLYLLTTLALTLGVLRLAKKKTLVQELYAIETLARVDVLCLDKTGTLTEGRMNVESAVALSETLDREMADAFTNVLIAQGTENETGRAVLDYFGRDRDKWQVSHLIPFSSSRKYSGASFEGRGSYFVGAAGILLPDDEELKARLKVHADQGFRVLLLVHSDVSVTGTELPSGLTPVGYLLISDVIRHDCKETLEFFKSNGVSLKCISGDDPATVSKIASVAGFENADRFIDVSRFETKEELRPYVSEYAVFGRVRPEQKKWMVEILQEEGHTVGMTGDGVNDVLAMKQADCSIAMASGSDAARQTANVVLLESDFTAMPSIFREGRRVINNIGRSASMYLLKTTFSVLLTFLTIVIGRSYPFLAMQISIISAFAVGIPTFLLQLEPSFDRIEKHYMRSIFRNALPPGIVVALFTFIITNIGHLVTPGNEPVLRTISVLCTGCIYFHMLGRIYSPMNVYRRIVVYSMVILYFTVMIIGQTYLEFETIPLTGVLILIGTVMLSPIAIDLITMGFDAVSAKTDVWKKKRAEKALARKEQ